MSVEDYHNEMNALEYAERARRSTLAVAFLFGVIIGLFFGYFTTMCSINAVKQECPVCMKKVAP